MTGRLYGSPILTRAQKLTLSLLLDAEIQKLTNQDEQTETKLRNT